MSRRDVFSHDVAETRIYYLPLAERHWILYYEIEEALGNMPAAE